VVWFYLQALPEVDLNGATVSYVGVLTDITALKQAETALQKSQLQLQQQLAEIEAIYQSAPIGLNFLDTELRFVRINERLAEINGLPVEAHIGRTIRELLPELADTAEAILRPILETGEPLLNVEIIGETPAQPGVQRIWLEHFLPLKNGDRIIGINTVCEEITERKRIEAERQQAEEALIESKEELEIRVAQRTAELLQRNAEKDILLQEIHHRVKNNLSIVSSLLQMQRRRTQDPHAGAILRDSQNRIASIALVHEKLYRSEDFANIDFTQYIRDLTIYLFDSYNISESRIQLTIQVDSVSLDLETAIPCGLIVNELVSNALKYAFPGEREGEIHVIFHESNRLSEGTPQKIFILSVRDDGIGLPNDFEMKKAKTLGITLVQGLVQQIQGTFEITSQQGTEAKVTFSKSDSDD
jgi:PAS domain S-box-containing protein